MAPQPGRDDPGIVHQHEGPVRKMIRQVVKPVVDDGTVLPVENQKARLIAAFGGRLGDEAVGKLEIEIREFQVEVNRVWLQVEVNAPPGRPPGPSAAGLK